MNFALHPETITPSAVALLKKFEGLHKVMADGRIRSYRCPAGKWTVGWGHTKGVRSNQHITIEQAEQFLAEDIAECIALIKTYVKVPLTQNQLDGLVLWVFNLGGGNLKTSTLLKKLNSGDYVSVPGEMTRWNKAKVNGAYEVVPGLVRRRAAEAALFAMDTPVGDVAPLPQKVETTSTKKPLIRSRTLLGASLAGVGTALSGLTEWASTLTKVADDLWPYIDTVEQLKWAWLALTIAGAALAAYARIDDHAEGVN